MPKKKVVGAKICHIEIPAPDLKRTMKFYSRVFGWQVNQPKGMKDYAFWSTEGGRGGFDQGARPGAGGAVLILVVDDIPAKLSEIEKAGGKKIKGKTALPPGVMGFYAYFDDPNGVRMGLWSKT